MIKKVFYLLGKGFEIKFLDIKNTFIALQMD